MRLRLLLAASTLAITATACVSMSTRGRFDAYGEIDRRAPSAPIVASAADVKVFYGTAPAGFSLRENELKVEPGFDHEILGTAHAIHAGGTCKRGGFTKQNVLDSLRETAYKAGGNAIIYAHSAISDSDDHLCAEVVALVDHKLGNGWVVVIAPESPALELPAPPAEPTAEPAAP